MTIIGLSNYNSKYGAESFQAMNEGYLTPIDRNGKDTFNKKYKKRQDPTSGVFYALATLAGGVAIFKNRKAIPGIIKSVKTGVKNFYNKLTLPSFDTIKSKAKQAGQFVLNLFTKKS